MITRKKKPCKCGCGREGYLWSHGMLKACYLKECPPKPIKKVSEKKSARIKDSNDYYLNRILNNIRRNKGVCRCDECDGKIRDPLLAKGSIVCHIISEGANTALYLDPENSVILGRGPLFGECNCKWVFDESGERESMKIFPVTEKIKIRLNAKYYAKD